MRFTNKRILIFAVIFLAVCSIGLVASVFVLNQYNNNSNKHKIRLNVVFEDYNADTFTRIPFSVAGNKNQEVTADQVFYGTPSDYEIELEPGQYTLTFPASPLCASGTIYKPPSSLSFEVPEDLADGETYKGISEKSTFTKMDTAKVITDDIENAAKFASKDPLSQDKVEEYKKASYDAKNAVYNESQQSEDTKENVQINTVADAEQCAVRYYIASGGHWDYANINYKIAYTLNSSNNFIVYGYEIEPDNNNRKKILFHYEVRRDGNVIELSSGSSN